MAHAGCFAAFGTHDLHVRCLNGAFFGQNLSFLSLFARPLMFFNGIQTLHDNAKPRQSSLADNFGDGKNFSGLRPVLSRKHYHIVAFFDVHTISCAKLAIVVNPRSLISRGIGPNTRPPLGSVPSRITTAFSSNLM